MCPAVSTRTLCPGSERLSLRLPRAPRQRRTFWGGQMDGHSHAGSRGQGLYPDLEARHRPACLTSVIYRAACQLRTLGGSWAGQLASPLARHLPFVTVLTPPQSGTRDAPQPQPNHSQALKMARLDSD